MTPIARSSRGSHNASRNARSPRQMSRKREGKLVWNSASQLPASAGRTRLRSATLSQSEAGVAQMRIMRPDTDLSPPTLPTEMRHQRLEGLDHMAVAQVPRRHFAKKHRPVIFFGVLDHARILLGVKELLLRDASIALRVLGGTAAQLDELADDLVFARSVEVAGGDETIDLRVRTEMVEAGITSPGPPCRVRVDLLEILQHGLHRGMEAVEIETVEAGLF